MLPFIKEENTLWEYLKTAGKPVVLYGTGDGADKVIAVLRKTGLPFPEYLPATNL